MKLKKLLKPINIDQYNWVYLEGMKVTLVHEVRDRDGRYNRTDQIKIPLKKIKLWFKEDKII